MKAVYLTIGILVIFFVGAILLQNYIQETCKGLTVEINKLEEYIVEENWTKAEETFNNINDIWRSKSKIWVLFLEHYNVDAIETAIGRIEAFSKLEEKALALGEVVKLKHLIKQVSDREVFALSNIL